ncbi:MAG TPA: aromatic aminobenezylarsenical efflux permease ArsG family transporter [Bellilinea sp.]|nr:aromatic aminobenezylarsenical efflux permease ArsG family transporter [Bellilinea sp.]
MEDWFIALTTAFWLGILTSISPCPLATNIAAISFVGRKVDSPRAVLASGVLYTGGRMITYATLGTILVASLLSAPSLSFALQKYMNLAMGPLLIVVGMVLLDLITLRIGGGIAQRIQSRAERLNIWGSGLLGIVFALSFCPTSAALFFGSVLPLAVKWESGLVMPGVYGIATGLPVLLFAGLLAAGTQKVSQTYSRVAAFGNWAKTITGIVFIAIGIYYSLVHIYGVPSL